MDEFIKLLNNSLDYVEHRIENNHCIITVKSNRLEAKCPYCGHTSAKVHSVYQKKFQDLPIQDKQVIIILSNRKMFCLNPECTHKTFAERFDFISYKFRKTKRLVNRILNISANVSSLTASKILKVDKVLVGKSTICNMLKKTPQIVDKNGILKVCVDDFAFKKRYLYGSILIDIETHRIIDLLDSREKEPVAKWLKKYINLQLVSRDGSHIYSTAIHKAHPNAIQVSDRFRLLKNLSEAVEKYMLCLFSARLEIPATKFTQNPEMQALLDTRNRYERIMFVRKKKSEGLTASEIALLLHASLSAITKYLQMKEEDIPSIKSSLRERENKTAIGKKYKKILYVRNLSKQGKSIEEIVRITGHTRQTVRNYLSDGCSIINGHYDNKYPGKLAPYETEIIKLRSQGVTYAKITEIIREKGYCGTVDALCVFMQKEREYYKNAVVGQETGTKEYIARKWIR